MNLVELHNNHSNLDTNRLHSILAQPGVDLNHVLSPNYKVVLGYFTCEIINK